MNVSKKNNSQAAGDETIGLDDDGIEVKIVKKKFFGLIKTKEKPKEEKGTNAYSHDTLQDRNPVDFDEIQRQKQREANRKAQLERKKRVEEEKKKQQQQQQARARAAAAQQQEQQARAAAAQKPDAASSKPAAASRSSNPLNGRNPVDFDKAGGYDNSKGNNK
jgi:DNA segregation ATPase FtsK/SpoIIIE-like protein